MSIFSALSQEELRAVLEMAKRSPTALAILAVTGVIAVLVLGLVVTWTARHVGGFYAHVEEEEEALREEERRAQETASRACQAEEPSNVNGVDEKDENEKTVL